MQNDLISRSALGIGKAKRECFEDPKYADGWNSAVDIINNAPVVDAVEVVRCKDCERWHEGTGWCSCHSHFITPDGAACHPWESANWKMFDGNDFCSYGERRADDGH